MTVYGQKIAIFAMGFFSTWTMAAMASGINCSTDDGLQVDIYNKLNAQKKWVPAVLLITNEDEGTILLRRGKEITEQDEPGRILYSAKANQALLAERLFIEIPMRALVNEKGESRAPELILLNDDERNVRQLNCRTF
jgi:hypothetical protein